MKLEISISKRSGSHLADGAKAVELRLGEIDPFVGLYSEIVLDFTGVRNANSSYINALVAGLIEQHGAAVTRKIIFKGCIPPLQVLIQAAVALGLRKIGERVHA